MFSKKIVWEKIGR